MMSYLITIESFFRDYKSYKYESILMKLGRFKSFVFDKNEFKKNLTES